jgi:hypothetical protein
MKQLTGLIVVFFCILVFSPVANAGIGVPIGRAQSDDHKLLFDGVWVSPSGSVTLIKEFQGYVIFQGKDAISTWGAQGVIKGNKVVCRGSGMDDSGNHFVYESNIHFEGGSLKESWKAIFPGGKEMLGNDTYKQLDMKLPDQTR